MWVIKTVPQSLQGWESRACPGRHMWMGTRRGVQAWVSACRLQLWTQEERQKYILTYWWRDQSINVWTVNKSKVGYACEPSQAKPFQATAATSATLETNLGVCPKVNQVHFNPHTCWHGGLLGCFCLLIFLPFISIFPHSSWSHHHFPYSTLRTL